MDKDKCRAEKATVLKWVKKIKYNDGCTKEITGSGIHDQQEISFLTTSEPSVI
jgi:hypothetical protein